VSRGQGVLLGRNLGIGPGYSPTRPYLNMALSISQSSKYAGQCLMVSWQTLVWRTSMSRPTRTYSVEAMPTNFIHISLSDIVDETKSSILFFGILKFAFSFSSEVLIPTITLTLWYCPLRSFVSLEMKVSGDFARWTSKMVTRSSNGWDTGDVSLRIHAPSYQYLKKDQCWSSCYR